MPIRRLALLVVGLASLAALPRSTRAQAPSAAESDAASLEAAKKAYREGGTAYDLGDWKTATDKFQEAYRLRPDPAFLYNIAQSYRQQNNYEQAKFFYKTYLRKKPDAPNKRAVEAKLEELEKLLAAQHKEATSPPVGLAQPTLGTVPPPPPGGPAVPPPPDATPVAPTPAPVSAAPSPSPSPAPTPVAGGPTDSKPPPGADLTATPPPAEQKPVYKEWWFWAGAGAALVLGAVVVAVAASNTRNVYPEPTLGGGALGPGK